jgi:hypothetical protein
VLPHALSIPMEGVITVRGFSMFIVYYNCKRRGSLVRHSLRLMVLACDHGKPTSFLFAVLAWFTLDPNFGLAL